MSIPTCSCGAELAPSELPSCVTCRAWPATSIVDRALLVLEQSSSPLRYWDIQRLMDRQSARPTQSSSLLINLSRDLRFCWAGKGMYGLYRHGLVPNVRDLGAAAEAHLIAGPHALDLDQIHFVLQHQGYRYQLASLAAALDRRLGHGWNEVAPPDTAVEEIRQEQRLAELIQISRRSPRFRLYYAAIQGRVAQALVERQRRLT